MYVIDFEWSCYSDAARKLRLQQFDFAQNLSCFSTKINEESKKNMS